MLFKCLIYQMVQESLSGRLAHDALNGSTTLSVGYAAHTNAAGTAVSADAAAYKAAGCFSFSYCCKCCNTIALGENSIVDANKMVYLFSYSRWSCMVLVLFN
jgi:hypothetical protein